MSPDGSFGIGREGAFEVRQLGADGHFSLVGELDLAAVDDLFAGLRDAIDRGGTITLDLRELTFLDVVGGHAIGVVGGMVAGRGSIALEAPSRSVLKLLKLVGAEHFAGIHIAALLSESA